MLSPSLPVIYLAPEIHRGGGMERAAFEVIDRLKGQREWVVIARRCDIPEIRHITVRVPRRPAVVSVVCFRWAARMAFRYLRRDYPSCITTGIGASGGPLDVVVAQYCQAAYRHRVGAVRGKGTLHRWYHQWTLSRFCDEERSVYRAPSLRRIIAVSRGVGRELVEFYGVDPAIIRYIPNGVDLRVFKPLTGGTEAKRNMRAEMRLPMNNFIACFVGGDWRRKGLRPAIEALCNLPDVHLLVVGSGDVEDFSDIAAAAGVGERVHFVGKRADPEHYLQASDVYVFPSLYEAFSLSCIEAAACGLPLLVTKINGTEELVEDGVTGFFVDADALSIAARLRQLRDNPDLCGRLAANSAIHAKKYGWDRIAESHELVYRELDLII